MSAHAVAADRYAPGHAPPRLLRARRRLRADLTQVLCALTGFVLAVALTRLEAGPMVQSDRLAGPLVNLGIGVIGVVSIVYSLLFAVVQWSASSFSPRLSIFRNDPLVWRTFALAVGLFVFCVTATIANASAEQVTLLVPGTAFVAVLAVMVLIRRLQTRAYLSLQLAHVLDAIASNGRAVIDDVYPVGPATGAGGGGTAAPLPAPLRTVIWTGPSSLVQQLDLRHLIAAATRTDAVVAFRIGVGDTLHEGSVLAAVHAGEVPDRTVHQAVVRGPERSFDQDPMFALRLLADIGLRALSPAVNDPATAVDALDAIARLLRRLAVRDLSVTDLTDGAGDVRVRLVLPTWPDYLQTAVGDLVPAASASAMVLRRIRRLIDDLLEMSPPANHPPLERLGEKVAARLAAYE